MVLFLCDMLFYNVNMFFLIFDICRCGLRIDVLNVGSSRRYRRGNLSFLYLRR